MARVPFHYIDFRAFSYATEDEKRVKQALQRFLPDEFDLQRVVNEGHHGDRIVVLSARVDTADEMRTVLGQVADLEGLDQVLSELDERVTDDCELFVRLDKQAAFGGDVRLGEGLTLRAKVEAYPAKKSAAVENARETLESVATSPE